MTVQGKAPSILVLGSNGRLGSILQHHWAKRRDVIWHSRRSSKDRHPDFLDAGLPGDMPQDMPPVTAVVALWGVVPGSGQNFQNNTMLALHAMQIAAKLGADRVLHCSSAAVYQPGPLPLTEDMTPCPQSAYGQAKLAMEQAVQLWHDSHGATPASCLMRIGNVIGADSLSVSMTEATRTGRQVRLDRFADGQAPYRSFLSGADLARCLRVLTDCPLKDLPGIVNLAAPRATSMEDLLHHAGLRIAWQSAPPQATPFVALETGRLGRLLDLGPESATAAHLLADWPWHAALEPHGSILKESQE